MKNLIKVISILSLLITVGCSKQKGEICYTYDKAIAVYGDIEDIRNQPLNMANQNVENITKVFYGDNFILIGEKDKGIHVVNSTNNKSLIMQSFINIPHVGEFYVEGSNLYVESLYDLLKVDISDPFNPNLIKRNNYAIREPFTNSKGEVLLDFEYITTSECFNLGTEEERELRKKNKLYFDFNNELIPESVIPHTFLGAGTKKGAANKMAYKNNYLYVLNRTSILTYSDGASGLSLVNTLDLITKNNDAELETVYLDDEKLYIGSNIATFIVDASNSASPIVSAGYFRVRDELGDIKVKKLNKEQVNSYVKNNSTELIIAGSIIAVTAAVVSAVIIVDPVLPNGDVAYITLHGASNELQVIDNTNQLNENDVLSRTSMTNPLGLSLLNDNTLVIGEGKEGLSVVDVSSPNSPTIDFHSNNIISFDVISHPTKYGEFLSINSEGISLYKYDFNSKGVEFLSELYIP